MALTVFFIVTFSILIAIPVIWTIVGIARGNKALRWAVLGIFFAIVLLGLTFGGMARNWGGCSSSMSASSEGAISCYPPPVPDASPCLPDVWKLECQKRVIGPRCPAPSPSPTPVPAGTFCPKGQKPVFDFCERIQTGGVKQPWATWSDLSFVAAGLWLFWFFQYFERIGISKFGRLIIPDNADNPMITVGWLSVIYGLVVIFMGPPSMWYHASLKEWAGWFDAMSVVTWLFFNSAYVWVTICGPMWGKLRGIGRPITVLSIWSGFLLTFGPLAWKYPDLRLILYFIAGGSWGLGELIYVFAAAINKNVAYRRTWWLFFGNFLLLGLTMFIWVLFNDDIVSPSSCQSRESFPGHAVFHILASFSTILTFFSFASERPVK
jgi:hypothetical protein